MRQHGSRLHKGGACALRAQEEGDKKSVVDKIASKGIWQFGVNKEMGEALSKVGWADEDEATGAAEVGMEEGSRVAELPRFEREDIEGLVSKAVAAEIFADERSKEVSGGRERQEPRRPCGLVRLTDKLQNPNLLRLHVKNAS